VEVDEEAKEFVRENRAWIEKTINSPEKPKILRIMDKNDN